MNTWVLTACRDYRGAQREVIATFQSQPSSEEIASAMKKFVSDKNEDLTRWPEKYWKVQSTNTVSNEPQRV